ncbi:MAG: SGNH/GDSL hydrolase family protein [Clostridia bacterium]|jgi:lysophospholipase L1-like esterase|nr:SGNH/GDSL hydrolase family protein [Clostridia bacterium]
MKTEPQKFRSKKLQSEIKDKRVKQVLLYFLGSSVTYGSATNGESFVEEIAKKTGYRCVKEAVSGTTLAVRENDGGSSYVARLKKLGADQNVSKLIVQLSTNDATQNIPLGKIAEDGEYNVTTSVGAIEYIIAYVKQTWNCDIVFYTNPYFNNVNYEKMIAELYALQKKHAIHIIDFYNFAIDKEKLSAYMSDAIHPNKRGYQWMSEVFLDYLQRI